MEQKDWCGVCHKRTFEKTGTDGCIQFSYSEEQLKMQMDIAREKMQNKRK
jgi:hypothetical protein